MIQEIIPLTRVLCISDILTGSWNILDSNLALYNSGLEHTDESGIITTDANAQNKTSGKFVFTVPSDAPDSLRYGTNNGSVTGTITINNPVIVDATFADLTAQGTTSLQALTTTGLTVSGNGTVTGAFDVEGTLTANSLVVDGKGVAEINTQTNIVLNAGNKIDIIIDNNLVGVVES